MHVLVLVVMLRGRDVFEGYRSQEHSATPIGRLSLLVTYEGAVLDSQFVLTILAPVDEDGEGVVIFGHGPVRVRGVLRTHEVIVAVAVEAHLEMTFLVLEIPH